MAGSTTRWQQVDGPATSAAAPDTVRLELTMAKGTGANWLQFAQSRISEAGERIDVLAARPTSSTASTRQPRRGPRTRPAAGLGHSHRRREFGDGHGHGEDLADNYPSPTLAPKWTAPASRRSPFEAGRVHRPIARQCAGAPRWRRCCRCTAQRAQPGLWLLPGDLVATAGGGQSTHAFDLMQLANGGGANQSPQPIAAWAWATLVDVAVQRIPGAPDLVEVHGADTADRQRLAQFLMHLGILPLNGERVPLDRDDVANLSLAWSLPPGPGDPQGLTTAAFDPAASFLVKTNLSTETHSGRSLADARGAAPTAGEYFASLGDVGRLLALLWECVSWAAAAIGSGWLIPRESRCCRRVRSIGRPDGPDARSSARQPVPSATKPPVRGAQPLPLQQRRRRRRRSGSGSVSLYATAAGGAETQRQATVRAGETGFTLDLDRPTPLDSGTPELRAERLFSLLGYQLLGESRLPLSGEGQPLAPQVKRGPDGKPIDNVWNLLRVVPVRRFYPSRLADISGLPPPDGDPYAGVNPLTDPPPNEQPAQAGVRRARVPPVGNTTSTDGKD